MRIVHTISLALLVGVGAFLAGCAPKVERSPALESHSLKNIAVLPATVKGEIARERVDAVHRALSSQLQASGFVVLDDAVVSRHCTSNGCKDTPAFFKEYSLDGLVSLTITSASRTNVIAGYFNEIHGIIEVTDASGSVLTSVDHRESEKGGLLFNTGQIFEGLRSTAKNNEVESFSRLAEKFGKTVALKLPQPSAWSGSVAPSTEAEIISLSALPTGSDGRYKVCAKGSPGGEAALEVAGRRGSLRELTPGNYCGIFALGGSVAPGNRVSVELRSPYGVVTEKALPDDTLAACIPEGILTTGENLSFTCHAGEATERCSERLAACKRSRLVIFRGASGEGPFQRVGTLSGEKGRVPPGEGALTILALAPDGGSSVPVTLASGGAK